MFQGNCINFFRGCVGSVRLGRDKCRCVNKGSKEIVAKTLVSYVNNCCTLMTDSSSWFVCTDVKEFHQKRVSL